LAKKRPFFIVGFFIIIGILAGAAIIIWIGASKYFEKGNLYVTYFAESVQGLQVDSRVKYQGVDVGWVKRIGISPDYRLIEVVMKIDFKDDLAERAVARLQMAGITGIVFVGLESKRPEHEGLTPRLNFRPPYPVIPSVPSEIHRLLSGTYEVIEMIKQIDFKDLSLQIKFTTRSIEEFLTDQEMKEFVERLNAASVELEAVSKRLGEYMREGGVVEDVVAEAKGAFSDARRLIQGVEEDIAAFDIKGKGQQADELIDTIRKRTDAITTELQLTSENLRQASEAMEGLMERLKVDPSDIIFSKPPPERKR
jgi:phospholipid/cholesterol/gamma-HCH transport system substrate-binding protein